MLRHLTVLNLLLAAMILLIIFVLVLPSSESPIDPGPDTVTMTADADTQESLPDDSSAPPASDFSLIAEQNLFHPERRLLEVDETGEAPENSENDFVLYGTLITDGLRIAYLEDLLSPIESPGRGKRQIALKPGDSIGGYIVEEIDTDRVVLQKNDERAVIYVNDPEKPKARDYAKRAATPKPAGTNVTKAGTKQDRLVTAPPKKSATSSKTRYTKTDVKKFQPNTANNTSNRSSSSTSGSRRGGGLLFPNR
jgi:hypothetical protein